MGPMLEALFVFVGIPVALVALLALVTYTAITAVRSFASTTGQAPASALANNVVAFRTRPVAEVVRDERRAA